MRLLDTTTLQLHTFRESNLPQYAILSHTWGKDEEEVTFQELKSLNEIYGCQCGKSKRDDQIRAKRGYKKIEDFCRQAREDGLSYAWVDTCCIDKTSSAELQEAINSMFRWYGEAHICYAYLADLLDTRSEIGHARWFARGWTLQELLAPRDVRFYTQSWEEIGTKNSLSLRLETITGIPEDFLRNNCPLDHASIAKRMSWASRRCTSRPEDTAYCLMGIFSIHMPMIYGEGDRAFYRLQEKLIETSGDEFIFAWRDRGCDIHDTYGVLAQHPSQFAESGDIEYLKDSVPRKYSITNQGLEFEIDCILLDQHQNELWCAMELTCTTGKMLLEGIGELLEEHNDQNVSIVLRVSGTFSPGRVMHASRVNVGQFVFSDYLARISMTLYIQLTGRCKQSIRIPWNPPPWCYRPYVHGEVLSFKGIGPTLSPLVAISPVYLSGLDSGLWKIVCWKVYTEKVPGPRQCLFLVRDDGEYLQLHFVIDENLSLLHFNVPWTIYVSEGQRTGRNSLLLEGNSTPQKLEKISREEQQMYIPNTARVGWVATLSKHTVRILHQEAPQHETKRSIFIIYVTYRERNHV